MSYARLEELGGIQWPCPTRSTRAREFLHGRLWAEPVERPARAVLGHAVGAADRRARRRLPDPPDHRAGGWTPTTPACSRASTARRCAAARRSTSRPRTPSASASSPARSCAITSRRGSIEAPVRLDPGLRPGLAFMTLHFPDDIDVNVLTIDATDPKSGTAEFKATAVRVEKLRERQTARCDQHARPASSVDLRLLDAEPTAAERDAVDAFLGPPLADLGGDRRDRRTATPPHGGHAAREQRHLLLPALHALQERAGWISPGGLNYVARRLTVPPADVYGVATFYALFSIEPRPPRVVHVCDDIACRCAGSEALIAELEERFGPEGNDVDGLAAQPVPGPVRPRAGGAAHRGRRRPARARAAPSTPTASSGPRPARRRPRRRRRAAAGRRPEPAAAAPRRPRRPREPRRLPRPRRLRGAAARVRARAGGRDPRGHRLEARRPRRRRVPDGPQVGGGRAPAAPPALPDLQRRRVRAGHVQGPRADGGRPVRGGRGDDDRRLRDRLRARLRLPARRVPARPAPARARDRRGARARLPRPGHPRPRLRLRHRDAQGRRRLHLRRGDRDLRLDRGLPRRAAQQAAVPGRRGPVPPADGGQQRRDAGQRARHRARGRPGVRRDRHREVDRARSSSACRARSSGPGTYEVPFGTTLRELLELAGGVPAAAAADGAAGRRGGDVRDPRRPRPAADLRGRPRVRRHARLRRRAGHRRHGRPRARCSW